MDHNYRRRAEAVDRGLMNQFVPRRPGRARTAKHYSRRRLVMDYYDGNTVTAYWNYAQRFAMNDNSFDTNFGPSTPGAINLVAGQTPGIYSVGAGPGEDHRRTRRESRRTRTASAR